jgi:hypothetical protein
LPVRFGLEPQVNSPSWTRNDNQNYPRTYTAAGPAPCKTAIAPIVGHEEKLVTSQVHWNKKDPVKRKPTVDRFQLPPELWRLLPKFKDITIAKGG